MFLSDKDIRDAVKRGEITLSDFEEKRLQPTSYDILLGNKFIINDPHAIGFIDPVNKIYPETKEIIVPDDGKFVLHPGVSVLGATLDYFGSDKYLIQLSGKSSLARLGLLIHNTAGVINPGHYLRITLELCNLNNIPIVLRPKMPIGQLLFSQITTPPEKDYKKIGRYNNKEWNSYLPPKDEVIVKVKVQKEKPKTKKKLKAKKK